MQRLIGSVGCLCHIQPDESYLWDGGGNQPKHLYKSKCGTIINNCCFKSKCLFTYTCWPFAALQTKYWKAYKSPCLCACPYVLQDQNCKPEKFGARVAVSPCAPSIHLTSHRGPHLHLWQGANMADLLPSFSGQRLHTGSLSRSLAAEGNYRKKAPSGEGWESGR